MDAVFNLGNPRKQSFRSVLAEAFPNADESMLPITGVGLFCSDSMALTSPAYGVGMVLDALTEMEFKHIINPGDHLVFVGSMGSFSPRINMGDLVAPNPCLCAYFGFDGIELRQDNSVLAAIRATLRKQGMTAIEYRHGSTFAVFDPHTDHDAYTTDLYDCSVEGVDIGEVFVGFEFARRKGMKAGALLYCSDSPKVRIAEIPAAEFSDRAAEFDLIINRLAIGALHAVRSQILDL